MTSPDLTDRAASAHCTTEAYTLGPKLVARSKSKTKTEGLSFTRWVSRLAVVYYNYDAEDDAGVFARMDHAVFVVNSRW